MNKSRIIICLLVALFFALSVAAHIDVITINGKFIINQIIGYVVTCAIVIYAHEVIASKKLNNQKQ